MQIISEELNGYLDGNNVALASITDANSEGSSLGNYPDISLTLINPQEEFTLKNTRNNYVNATISYKNLKIYLNLFVVFSINKSTYTEPV